MGRSYELHEASGKIIDDDPFIKFLYFLMRDYLPVGDVEIILQKSLSEQDAEFSNGYLAQYAQNIREQFLKVSHD